MKTYHTAIIGGGISGLSLAHYCAQAGYSTLVLERDDQSGGSFRSHATESGGFWFELGAHTCYNSYQNLIELLRDCQLVEQIQARTKAPFKMLVANDLKSIFSQIKLFELLVSVPRLFSTRKKGQTVRSYYGNIVGQGNFQRIFSALFSAVPSQKADDFPAEMLFKKRARNKDIAKSFTMQRGLQSIAEAVAAHPNIEFKTVQDARTITRAGERFCIQTAAGDSYISERLALATPPPVAAKLLENIAPSLARHLKNIAVAKVESMGVAVAKEKVKLEPFAGAIPRDDCFFSIVSRDVYPHADYRAFTFHFAPNALDREAKLQRIAAILQVDPADFHSIGEKTNVVPSPKLGHDVWLEETDQLLAEESIFLTGNYFAGLSIEDCVSRSRSEFARM
jgi:protoporphyrinogen oxidase